MTTPARNDSLPPKVHRARDGYSVVLTQTPGRQPRSMELVAAVAQGITVVLAVVMLVVPTVVGLPGASMNYRIVYAFVFVAIAGAGIGGASLLARLLLNLAGGQVLSRLAVRSTGFVYAQRGRVPVEVAWCAVHDVNVAHDGVPAFNVLVGWPNPSGEVHLHELSMPLDTPVETTRWLSDTFDAWRQNTEAARPATSEVPAWVGRTSAPPRGLQISNTGSGMEVGLGTHLRGLDDPSMRMALTLLFTLPLAVPAIGMVFWLLLPVVHADLVPIMGVALALSGVLLVVGCGLFAWIALRRVSRHLTRRRRLPHGACRWSAQRGPGGMGERSRE
ncbi:MAG: hypothetical protein ACI9MC_000867 [Kiritimatiellia bacterium]|jgi:hypothetical protein